ncbi:hypothetical protein [Thalassotalea marina]|uniref:Uncharacterized protein n=1 Tax=Thalassotalea marina TaxID=1673741 RepID=A0A919BR95_9GAMM|nr:hypothetical protein [Thalassotalea marina]GHG07781.1 hypothetical protein GCM10017161_41890 [Thalassotalea marina]
MNEQQDKVKPLGSDSPYWHEGVDDANMGKSVEDNPLLGSAGQSWLLGFQWQTQRLKEEYDANSQLIKEKLEAAKELLWEASGMTVHDEYNKETFYGNSVDYHCREAIEHIDVLFEPNEPDY